MQTRYYDSVTGRFINADGYVTTGQGLISYNMYAYCGNNPIMHVDYSGELFGSLIVFGAVCVGMIFSLTSSEKQVATPEQIQHAYDAAERAVLKEMNTNDASSFTIYIHIDTEDALDSVDEIAYPYYYQRLYDRTVEKANELNMPIDNLMSVDHIAWEFRLHALAFTFGFSAAKKTDLNIEETPWKMFRRAFGW